MSDLYSNRTEVTTREFYTETFWQSAPEVLRVCLEVKRAELSPDDIFALNTALELFDKMPSKPAIGGESSLDLDISLPELTAVPVLAGADSSSNRYWDDLLPEYLKGAATVKFFYTPQTEGIQLMVNVNFEDPLGDMDLPDGQITRLSFNVDGIFSDAPTRILGSKNELPGIQFRYVVQKKGRPAENNALTIALAPSTMPIEEIEDRLVTDGITGIEGAPINTILHSAPLRMVKEIPEPDTRRIRTVSRIITNMGVHDIKGLEGPVQMFFSINSQGQRTYRSE